MPTLEILWSAYWPTLLIFAVIALAVFGYFFTSLAYGIRTDPERTSADDSGRAALRAAVPDLIACACQTCRFVRTVDQRWLPPGVVPLPVGCRISHGICPACERLAMLELGKLPARPMVLRQSAPTLSPLVPVSAG